MFISTVLSFFLLQEVVYLDKYDYIIEPLLIIIPIVGGIILAGLFISILVFAITRFRHTKNKVSKAEDSVEKEPDKVKPAWDLARATLESYFNINLVQINLIFLVSVIVMCVGFGIIIWGVSSSITQIKSAPNKEMISAYPSIIATLAGIITEFIGATFLFIYRSTIQQAVDYTKTLERINSVGMAMQILDTMPDRTEPNDLKSKTKAILVEMLIKQANEISSKTQKANMEKKEEEKENK